MANPNRDPKTGRFVGKNFDSKEFNKEFEESINIAQDGINSLGDALNNKIKKAARETSDELQRTTLNRLSKQVTKAFQDLDKQMQNQAKTRRDLADGELSYNQLVKKGKDLKDKIYKLEQKRNEVAKNGGDLSEEELSRLREYTDLLEENQAKLEDVAIAAERRAGALGEIFTRISKTPFLGDLLNAEEGVKAMRKELVKGGSSIKALGKGFKALTKGLGPVVIVVALIKTFKSLLDAASASAKAIAVNLGVSMGAAEGFRKELLQSAGAINGIFYTMEELQGSLGEIVKAQGLFTSDVAKTAVQVNFLTQGLGIAGENAVNLNNVIANQGDTSRQVFTNVGLMAQEFQKATGIGLTARQIFKEIGTVSADILANFGNNIPALVKAVAQTRRFGVTLTQAKNIANGLLDFEQSIGKELEAEILLGRQFSFERARALAATGDIAGATEEVLKQTQSLTDEQLKSPIIQQAVAEATGLSADELFRAREITKKLNITQDKYNDLLSKGANIIGDEAMMRLMATADNADMVEQTLTVQEKFNRALDAAKQQFSGLVNSGVLDMLTNSLPGIIRGLAKMFGDRQDVERMDLASDVRQQAMAINEQRKKQKLDPIDVNRAVQVAQTTFDNYYRKREAIKNREGGSIIFKSADAAGILGTVSTNREAILENTLKEIQNGNKKTDQLIKELSKNYVLSVDEQKVFSNLVVKSTN